MKPSIGEKVWVWFHWYGSYTISSGVVTGFCSNGVQAAVYVPRCPYMKNMSPRTVYPNLSTYGKRPHWVPVNEN